MTKGDRFPWRHQYLTRDMAKVFSFVTTLSNLVNLVPGLRVHIFIGTLVWIAALLVCTFWVARCFVYNHFPVMWPVKVRCACLLL